MELISATSGFQNCRPKAASLPGSLGQRIGTDVDSTQLTTALAAPEPRNKRSPEASPAPLVPRLTTRQASGTSLDT